MVDCMFLTLIVSVQLLMLGHVEEAPGEFFAQHAHLMDSLVAKHVQIVVIGSTITKKVDIAELRGQAAKASVSGTGSGTVYNTARERA